VLAEHDSFAEGSLVEGSLGASAEDADAAEHASGAAEAAGAAQPGDAVDHGDDETARSEETDDFWASVRVDPVEIALRAGVGYTLRAYRLSSEVSAPEIIEHEDELAARRKRIGTDDDADDYADDPDADEVDDEIDSDVDSDSDIDDDDDDAEDEDGSEDDAEEAEPEEVPVFLAQGGRLLLFRTPQALVEYVKDADDHDLVQLDTWDEVRQAIEVGHVTVRQADRYELDLVVENLRGGHDAWDPTLIIQAGEIARDLGHALRIESIIAALAPGSPLDDLDEGVRAVEAGGFGSFFARRRVRKIDAQTTAALGWRTIIGKISAAVDWRN